MDMLTDYESQPGKRPWLHRIACVLYSATVIGALLTDYWYIQKQGFWDFIENGGISIWLCALDVLQIFILAGFIQKSKIAWTLVPLVQGMFAAMFLKNYYTLLSVYGLKYYELIFEEPFSLFFCINAIVIVTLTLQPKMGNYLTIGKNYRLIITAITIVEAIVVFIIR